MADNNPTASRTDAYDDAALSLQEVIDLDRNLTDDEIDELVGEELRFRVGHNLKFSRLDKYLVGRFSQFSRTHMMPRLIREQGVHVNDHSAKPSHQLKPGDEIRLILPPRERRELIPEDIPVEVIYEDDDMVIINKQANLIVHPARGYKHGTLVNGLVYHFQNQLSHCPDDIRPGIVHRLDRNTTGCLAVAKTEDAQFGLSTQFANRTAQKTYLAIAHGAPELDADIIDQPLGVHPSKREKYAVRPDGKPSTTIYHVLERFRGYSLIELDLKTGRTHQIRVHLSWIKHPIVADDMYGGKIVYPWQIENRDSAPEDPLLARCALHAWKLEITHPITKERMKFEAPLPPDMQKLLDELREHRRL